MIFKESENTPQPSVLSTCRDTGTEEQKNQICTVSHSNHFIEINKTHSLEESHISEMSQLQTAV